MAASGEDDVEQARARFEADARATGLVVPRPRRLNGWAAAVIVLVLIGATLAVGDVTGWAIGPTEPNAEGGVFGPDECARAPAGLSVNLSAAVSGSADPILEGSLLQWGSAFSLWSGGCVHLLAVSSSGDGYVPNLSAHSVDLVVSNSLPNASDRADLGAAIEVVPVVAVPVALEYNLPGISGALHLSGRAVAGIYLGTITSWADPTIATLNPGIDLGSLPPIDPIYRSASTAVNAAFTAYLADSNATWSADVGVGPTVNWPTGTAAVDAAAAASDLADTPGAVAYLDVPGTLPPNVSAAQLANPDGGFVGPSPSNATAALVNVANSTAAKSRDWANVSFADAVGASAYPIVEPVYSAVFADLGRAYSGSLNANDATWLLTFLWWLAVNSHVTTNGEGFAALPPSFAKFTEAGLQSVLFNGGPLIDNETGESGETGEF